MTTTYNTDPIEKISSSLNPILKLVVLLQYFCVTHFPCRYRFHGMSRDGSLVLDRTSVLHHRGEFGTTDCSGHHSSSIVLGVSVLSLFTLFRSIKGQSVSLGIPLKTLFQSRQY